MGQSLLQTSACISKWSKFITKWGKHYYKVGQLRTVTKEVKSYCKVGQVIRYKVMWKSLQRIEAGTTKWNCCYKVDRYINQMYLKKLVNKIYCSPSFLSFAYLPQGPIEWLIYKQDHCSLRVELHSTLKSSSEGTDLFRKIYIFVRACAIYNTFAP